MPAKVIATNPNRGFPGSSFRYTPLQHVRVLFVSFIQGLFAQAPPGAYRWSPDFEVTELVITDESPINIEKIGSRPAITFTRGPVQFYSLGLDDMLGFDFDIERKTKGVLVPGTMSVNCCSRSDLESEQIAWVVAEHIWLLRELLLKQGFFEIGRQPQISAPSPAGSLVANDEGDEWYATTVAIPYQFARKSAFTPLGKKIAANIELSLNTIHDKVLSKGVPQGGHEIPLNVHACFPPSFAPDASDSRGGTPDPTGLHKTSLPLQPHPLNPAARVVVRTVYPNRAGLRPPSIGGRPIPIADPCMEESGPVRLTAASTVKV